MITAFTSSVPSHSFAPVLLRPRNFQWYWNSAADPWSLEEWMMYTDVENEIIEDAFNEKNTQVETDDDYVVDFKRQVQYKKHDDFKQRPIKRVQLDCDRSNINLREERFSLPITLKTLPSSTVELAAHNNSLVSLKILGNFSLFFHVQYVKNSGKTIGDITEDAARGIVEEGTLINKKKEAEWLADKLLGVKHYHNNVILTGPADRISDEIGQTCVYLYSKESFWYKLINKILRNLSTISLDQVKTIGPFCYLLNRYLCLNRSNPVLTVYRGLTLTDEQRQEFMKENNEELVFTAFTSTSKNRLKAERFGNTLLIIDLDVKYYTGDNVFCGAYVSPFSAVPNEEEFLMYVGTRFHFVRNEYDNINKKHIIYLKATESNG
jgi:hypothetical protein